jgi:hypothetical protein
VGWFKRGGTGFAGIDTVTPNALCFIQSTLSFTQLFVVLYTLAPAQTEIAYFALLGCFYYDKRQISPV